MSTDQGGAGFNPPPGWPAATGSTPGPLWTPETHWPKPPRSWPFYVDRRTGRTCAPPTGAWDPAGTAGRSRRQLLGAGSIVLVVILVAVIGAVVWINRPVALPGSFAGGKLISPSAQYARDLAAQDPMAQAYRGKPADYRTYLKQAYLGALDGPQWPIRPREALVGRYDRPKADVQVSLAHFAVDPPQWTPAVQQELVQVALGETPAAVAPGVYCAGTADDIEFQYCVRIGHAGFWVGTINLVDGDAIGDPTGLHRTEIAAEMATLR